MKRFSISGTHSVGKTTLADCLFESLRNSVNIKLIPEIARELIARGFLLNQNITEWGIVNYVTEYLYQERNICADIVLSDRSLIDLLAYIKTNKSIKIRKKYIQLVEEVVFEESKRFNHYFYLPIEFPLVLDEVRPSDISYQKEVDNTLKTLFKYYNIQPIIISGNVNKRLKDCSSWMYDKN
ncbi:ATP-binding protein [Bacteroidales bacterium OttesenSCG-928-I14]|nr:ATP-binding protein [Bacteroidales bacterium OttesenSCG-928-I14]